MNSTPPYWNYTMNQGMTGVVQTVTTNIPFAFPLINIAIMLVMFYYTSTTNYGRKKYIPIFFMAWLFSILQVYFGLLPLSFSVLLFIIYASATFIILFFGD